MTYLFGVIYDITKTIDADRAGYKQAQNAACKAQFDFEVVCVS